MIEASTTAIDTKALQGTDAEIKDVTTATRDHQLLLAAGSFWLVLGALSGSTPVTAATVTLAVIGALGLIGAVIALRAALEADCDITVFALVLPGSLQPIASALLLVYGVTRTPTSALLVAAPYLAEGLMRIGLALLERFPGWGWQFLHGILALSLGVAVLSMWPQPSMRVVQLCLGIDVAFAGLSCLILGGVLSQYTAPLSRSR